MENINNKFDWTNLVGKKVRIFYDDGRTNTAGMKQGILIGFDEQTLFLNDGEGIARSRYIRHEVMI